MTASNSRQADLNNLALAYRHAGRMDEAIALFERVRDARAKALPPEHPSNLTVQKYAEAEPLLKEGYWPVQLRLIGPCSRIRQNAGRQPAFWRMRLPINQSGTDHYEGLKACEKTIPQKVKGRLTEALERLVKLYDAWGKPEQAAVWRRQLAQAKPPAPKANP